ncbi:RING finger protein 145-like [Galendromus occidentalis]|uniref:RING finger protein 145-like n=1 Tax=Galendromus occidentalis TaxID=34638 RepID=A0AAJ6QUW9_9ACAR|nr:RING finger protein 145-like [Galendromus occidentalis]
MGKLVNAFGVALDSTMRVPALFLVDQWYRSARSHPPLSILSYETVYVWIQTNAVFLSAFTILFLPATFLHALYKHALSMILLIISHFVSDYYVSMEVGRCSENPKCDVFDNLPLHSTTLLTHVLLTVVIRIFLENPRYLQSVAGVYTLPIAARMLGAPVKTLPAAQLASNTVVVIAGWLHVVDRWDSTRQALRDLRSRVTVVLDTVDPLSAVKFLYENAFSAPTYVVYWFMNFATSAVDLYLDDGHMGTNILYFTLQCCASVCVTPLNVLATAVVVSYVAYGTIQGTSVLINAERGDTPMHSGWAQGAMMFVLGVQTGLMDLPTAMRPSGLLVILFVVVSSLLQSVLEITEPVVLSLGASRSVSGVRHAKALAVCLVLFVMPLLLTAELAEAFPLDFWILMVIGTCILTSVRVLGTLTVHCIFVYDGIVDDGTTDLDDVVYYARAVIKVLEFIVALCVVAAGVHENFSGKWNMANIVILVIHTYFNVYQRMQAGWKSFLSRHEASIKTLSLANATDEQIVDYNDVCPICYQSLQDSGSVCITPCSHLFHRNCLRKWLYSQAKCPMCHKKVMSSADERDFDKEAAVNVLRALEREVQ